MTSKRNKLKHVSACSALRRHFGSVRLEKLIAANRTYPVTSRVDLQVALDKVFSNRYPGQLLGVHAQYNHDKLTIGELTREGNYPVLIGPLQHDEVDVGEAMPARCLKRGLWLSRAHSTPFALLVTQASRFGQEEGLHVEVAVPPGEAGLKLSRAFLDEIEKLVNHAASYRGKVISLEATRSYSGKAGSVKVHRLPSVRREDVILPEKTLGLLERNVRGFIQRRERLRALGMALKKGLLFYGPPGTGKTHTIQYLASQLPNHTTLLITTEQVGLLDEYFQLARFLQPAMVVIEDVDLIARDREDMHNPCAEGLLNKLLNEMDGLREDAAVLFVLTTNRPEQLEAALASRPGRVDQAVEFPLPDEDGRKRLVRLYARNLKVSDELAGLVVRKTRKASAAFIKELMRRCAQYMLQDGTTTSMLAARHVDAALDEMLFAGGSLNAKLLGCGSKS
jgi:hypothetical protein